VDRDGVEAPYPVRAVGRWIPLAPATLGAALACLSLAHLGSVGDDLLGAFLALGTGTVGIALALSSLLWRGHRLGHAGAHAVLAGCILLAAADTLAYVRITGGLERTADLMLLVLACGGVLLGTRWYLGTLSLLLGGWIAVAAAAPTTAGFQGLALVTSVGLGIGVRRARVAAVAEAMQVHARAALAAVDLLTGLPDSRGVPLVAAHLLAIARRESGAIGCTFVDVDGYATLARASAWDAEALLVHVAGVLTSVSRGTDVVGRWHGSQFVVVTHGQGAPMDVFEGRIARAIEQGCPVGPQQWNRRLLLGRAVLQPWDEGGLPSLIAAAEHDLYVRQGLAPPSTGQDVAQDAARAAALRTTAEQGEAAAEAVAAAHATLEAASEASAKVDVAGPELTA
jgi:GGDEF domain-containing protein